MKDPFILQDGDISGGALSDGLSRRWVENTAPIASTGEIEYLKPSLKRIRMRFGFIIFSTLLFLLLGRSAQLQVIETKEYRAAAEKNRLRLVRIAAPRGGIQDRNGIALTSNIPRFALVLNPLDLPKESFKREEVLRRISELLDIPLDELRANAAILRLPIAPITLKSNLALEQVYPLLITLQDISGVSIETASVRQYTGGDSFSHILGYLGKIDESQKNNYMARGYSLNAQIGKSGIEAAFEDVLSGVDGRKYVEVDAKGQIQKVVALKDASPGTTVKLTIDAELQQKATDILAAALKGLHKTRGAVVIMNPASGDILALVSLPAFDNNIFNGDAKMKEKLQEVFNNPDHPLFPRAISGTYPSGSTIKLAIAASALQEGVITRATSFISTGGLRIGQWFFPDWKTGGHGITNVTRAIAESINTFFYIIGGGYNDFSGLGITRLTQYLREFGFGAPTGIEVGGEAPGLVPTPDWKTENRNEQWYIGDTYHLAIGQGDFLVTPLQIARMTAYFASSGKWTVPHLSMNHESPHHPAKAGGTGQAGIRNQENINPGIDLQNIETVRQGMREAVFYGSARALQTLPITSAGKTGTAQWSDNKSPHAWFTGFAPYENPQITITVLVEEGGEGSAVALPVAKEIMRWWFTRDLTAK
ncbi:penicillin-binding protein 2 [Candidatus Uhrbacteria bacterium RIFCSPLOWO2_01_FULL_47_24]|uniref:Penicillin-binding protein 2 n=1 Tax=Candidatus Uhrbacteria bacterium RIFCSPLOWO2_01_FULL_47_24 TaxID=1802401 RepID=A0A1F7USR0_9BACT|nr:MAG: penicillin-binding protein 2 [Candidatus Uhrbacteria bacterium RIFCSPHIGHO2_01_FULL_47_11]OGL68895.1 MAG: penicillin-binding protein 2 [Candidatus Uhrbacteria bacterium RIFCSPHIGHO2_02_FULL_46_47]OGL75292.1 MAG: penicillin-binding protein 2 [Candidatus Uhrbacteria bacterium RIFCSPHIGHO2_12_FULL_47_11]OGL81289.1 MAG: penicillin-binding protein 2 [Candidatus Uhrbacteria bacterium RIFCSPLOWO2_01_FULL_47_24]OGL85176.1 MAG: penicillin-binding protein 2 [Candidatus Uhrbacteria bacterium RIFCS